MNYLVILFSSIPGYSEINASLMLRLFWQSSVLIISVWIFCRILGNRIPLMKRNLWIAALATLPFLPLLNVAMERTNVGIAVDTAVFERIVLLENAGTRFTESSEQSQSQTQNNNVNKSWNPHIYGAHILIGIYVLGVFFMAGMFIRKLLYVKKHKKHGNVIPNPEIFKILDIQKQIFGINRKIRLMQSDKVTIPFVSGIIKPIIFFPPDTFRKYDKKTISMIISHECAHIAMNDNVFLLYAAALQVVLFFHPMIWLAVNWFTLSMEEAADHTVMKKTTIDAETYSSMLFGMAVMKLAPAPVLPFSCNNKLLTRITTILDSTKESKEDSLMKKIRKYVLIAGVGITLAACFLIQFQRVQPLQAAQNNNQEKSAQTDKTEIFMTVSGKVLSPEGKPVPDVIVDAIHGVPSNDFGNSIMGDDRYAVKTDNDGKFLIKFPKEISHNKSDMKGSIILTAHPGNTVTYIDEHKWLPGVANGSSEPLNVKKGDFGPVTIKLTKASTIEGVVVKTDGSPFAGCEVKVAYQNGIYNRYYRPFTKTDESGRFVLTNVNPGKIWIIASPVFLIYRKDESIVFKGSGISLDIKGNERIKDIRVISYDIEEIKKETLKIQEQIKNREFYDVVKQPL